MAIFELQSKDEYREAVIKNSSLFLRRGQEGECFLGKDNYIYKVFKKIAKPSLTAEAIITSDQVYSPNFVFPNQVYTCNGEIIGTQTNYVHLIDKYSSFEDLEDKFIKAVFDFSKELARLTSKGFIAIDFGDNFIFDGETLYNIDTTNHAFDHEGKFSTDYLLAWNFTGLIKGLRKTLGEDVTPNIDNAFNILTDKYINSSLDNLVPDEPSGLKM